MQFQISRKYEKLNEQIFFLLKKRMDISIFDTLIYIYIYTEKKKKGKVKI